MCVLEGILTSSSHKVVNSEAFLPAVFVKRIFLSILLVEIFEAGIMLEEAMLWLFWVFFLLAGKKNASRCVTMCYLYKTNYFLKLKINSRLPLVWIQSCVLSQ